MTEATPKFSDDSMLVNLLREGNDLAFQRIYNKYWERLFAYTYNRLHVREASEEVVQDVFFSLWLKRESIYISSSLSSYLYGATRHRLLNELRSAKVRKAYAIDYASFARNCHDNSNIEHQNIRDLQDSLEARILELPKQCQTVFRLSRQEQMPNKKIAARLNISLKTVENYITHALKYLRTSLGEFHIFIFLIVLL